MIDFPRVKAAGYAIAKRLQGYHLLKNPKGIPQTEVHMIKTINDGVNVAGTRGTITSKITRTVDEFGHANTKEKTIITERIYDFGKKKFSKAENIDLFISRKNSIPRERHNYTDEQLEKLPTRTWEEINDILYQMYEFKEKTKTKTPNFFKVLYHNLTNKA